MNEKTKDSIIQVDKALARLHLAIGIGNTNELAIDGTVQRFEFTIELFWKMLKRVLLEQGIGVGTPREKPFKKRFN